MRFFMPKIRIRANEIACDSIAIYITRAVGLSADGHLLLACFVRLPLPEPR